MRSLEPIDAYVRELPSAAHMHAARPTVAAHTPHAVRTRRARAAGDEIPRPGAQRARKR
jgi:hypothetical protein